MKIGIVTFWTSEDNFGQMLQLYALQRILKKCNHLPTLIRTQSYSSKIGLKTKIKVLISRIIHLRFSKLGGKDFKLFLNENISYTNKIFFSPQDFSKSDLQYDAVICGSDVVWSEGIGTGDWGRLCFLDFVAAPIKKISYAASFGAPELSEKFSDFIKPMIRSFDAISVREESGVSICAKLGRSDAVAVCDPTLLLKKDEYEILLTSTKCGDQTAFAYFIGWDSDIPEREIKCYTKEKKWSFSRIDCQNYKMSFKQLFVKPKSIPEWLLAYRNAPCIFTNSFHGTIFALIFNKPFLFFPIKGTAQKLNNRVENLLGKFGLLDRIWNSNRTIQEQMDEHIDWNRVNNGIDEIRDFSLNWLERSLNM